MLLCLSERVWSMIKARTIDIFLFRNYHLKLAHIASNHTKTIFPPHFLRSKDTTLAIEALQIDLNCFIFSSLFFFLNGKTIGSVSSSRMDAEKAGAVEAARKCTLPCQFVYANI